METEPHRAHDANMHNVRSLQQFLADHDLRRQRKGAGLRLDTKPLRPDAHGLSRESTHYVHHHH
jgi:hypothetical protein